MRTSSTPGCRQDDESQARHQLGRRSWDLTLNSLESTLSAWGRWNGHGTGETTFCADEEAEEVDGEVDKISQLEPGTRALDTGGVGPLH